MLSLETCKALAEKYAEVREHHFRPGDMYFLRSPDGGFYENGCAISTSDHYSRGEMWCPRLGDLLEIATTLLHREQPDELIAVMEWRYDGEPDFCCWVFGGKDAHGDRLSWKRIFGQGITPEDAVAEALLSCD